jgi:dTDP-4-amino-4,6-dideoxygalactose transaminase
MNQNNTISLSEPILGEQEKQALCAIIDSGWLSMGERVTAFERAFAALHGVENAVAVSSCTAGLHLCLAALNIGPGDEVLVPSLTFVATVNAVLYVGAKPVFVDIERNDLPHLSLADAKAKCTARTKAVIVMHYGGYLIDLPAWRSFADLHWLALIEDAAHAPAMGETGRWGDAAAFSFFTNKNMTTAEGGMVLARDATVLQRIRHMRAHGMTTGTLERYQGHAYSYDVTLLGYNYRLDELRAAMGLVQLACLPQWNAQRRALTNLYRARLAESIPEVSIPFGSEHETAAHLMPILLPSHLNRENVMTALRKMDIQTSIHYPPVHRFSYYRERFPDTTLPNTEEFSARVLSLPLHPQLSESDVSRIAITLWDALSRSSYEHDLQANS